VARNGHFYCPPMGSFPWPPTVQVGRRIAVIVARETGSECRQSSFGFAGLQSNSGQLNIQKRVIPPRPLDGDRRSGGGRCWDEQHGWERDVVDSADGNE